MQEGQVVASVAIFYARSADTLHHTARFRGEIAIVTLKPILGHLAMMYFFSSYSKGTTPSKIVSGNATNARISNAAKGTAVTISRRTLLVQQLRLVAFVAGINTRFANGFNKSSTRFRIEVTVFTLIPILSHSSVMYVVQGDWVCTSCTNFSSALN